MPCSIQGNVESQSLCSCCCLQIHKYQGFVSVITAINIGETMFAHNCLLYQDGKVSVWSRSSEGLSFSSTSTFDLLPRPIRNPSAPLSKPTITTASSMIWRAMNAASRKEPSTMDAKDHNRLLPNPSLLVITVMSNGQVWQWDIPLAAYCTVMGAANKLGDDAVSKSGFGYYLNVEFDFNLTCFSVLYRKNSRDYVCCSDNTNSPC